VGHPEEIEMVIGGDEAIGHDIAPGKRKWSGNHLRQPAPV
jgi:hypothetical protein